LMKVKENIIAQFVTVIVKNIMKNDIFYCPDCLDYEGSWLGLSSHLRGDCERSEHIKINQLIFSIIKTKDYLNEVPSVKQMNKIGPVSERPIINSFGSYNNALLEAGFSPKNPKNVSGEKLINELKRVSEEYCDGKTPRVKDIQKFSIFSHKIFINRFESWNKAVEKAGFPPNLEIDIKNKKLINDLKRVSEEYCDGDIPRAKDIIKHGKYSVSTFERVFDSWNNSLEEAGFQARKRGSWVSVGKEASRYGVRGADHPCWKGGYNGYYGRSWRLQQRKALERDNYRCQYCLKSESDIGRKPDVHHIKPKYKWNVKEEHEEMNDISNLICLCRSCHHQLEGKWQDIESDEFAEKAKKYN